MKLEGIYHATARGFGFFTPDGALSREESLFVPPHCDGGAWTGDRVSVRVSDEQGANGRRVARVSAVLERTNRTLVGTVDRRGREVWLQPDGSRYPHAVKVVGRSAAALKGGEKIAVSLKSYGSATLPPMGTLEAAFGRNGTREAGVAAILYRHGVEPGFPDPVLAAAALAPAEVRPADCDGRLDLRGERIITIDGDASKDFDDAVSLKRDGAGGWVLGVHIADVSHYVPEGSPLDLEAFRRGTSLYYADQVVPMLPEALSNGICSLNPRADRLALSCLMTLDAGGAVVEHTIVKTVIHSSERMTYSACNRLLAGDEPEPAGRYAHILPMLRDMAALSQLLEKRRRLRGALDLESRECAILCDGTGAPVDVRLRALGQSEGIIESFMLAANECVAEHLQRAGLPAVYRVHEKPTADRVENLRLMLAPLGLSLREADHGSLQKILEAVKGSPQAPAVHAMVLRSLMKARYATENLGHFGLAARYYCHFTSPIRRYPDLMVHRILTAMLDGTCSGGRLRRLSAAAERAALQSSDREVHAMAAEREIERCYLAEFMTAHLGETFTGAVSGVSRFGLFVTLQNGVEGLVPLSALPEDQYEYDEVGMTLAGGRSGRSYTFGTPLEVVCVSAEVGSGQITFFPAGVEPAPPRAPSARRTHPAGKSKKTAAGKPAHRPPKRGRRGKGRKKQ